MPVSSTVFSPFSLFVFAMNKTDLRTLQILEQFGQDETTSQRRLAGCLGISLGLANTFVKRLAANEADGAKGSGSRRLTRRVKFFDLKWCNTPYIVYDSLYFSITPEIYYNILYFKVIFICFEKIHEIFGTSA